MYDVRRYYSFYLLLFILQGKFSSIFVHKESCSNETLIFETRKYETHIKRKTIPVQQFFDKITQKKSIEFLKLPEFFLLDISKSKLSPRKKITMKSSDNTVINYDLVMVINNIENNCFPIVVFQDK